MSYHYPGPIHPFPHLEAPLLFFGAGGIVAWTEYGRPQLLAKIVLGLGITVFCLLSLTILVRTIWNDQPISDDALATLRSEAISDSIAKAWTEICGDHRRPTWRELEIIVEHASYLAKD